MRPRRSALLSGSEGTVLRTTDGGHSWASVGPPGAGSLQFRDVEATSADHAVILSIGEGSDSRIYVTDDGGRSWAESFRNAEPSAFWLRASSPCSSATAAPGSPWAATTWTPPAPTATRHTAPTGAGPGEQGRVATARPSDRH